ncbi:MAG: dephospho-CoA kinase [Puniceicoccales bacterium]|jgi:dephospho-CoA kinase|nr:dephospho-CoA kinase [Puniceicoccales bacterium]
MRIALTGGIACGKSTAAALFAKHGCAVISTDAITHEVLNDPAMLAPLGKQFGAGILLPGGSINRRVLSQIVFADPQARAALEALVHPEINRRWRERMERASAPLRLVEIPLLFEKKLEQEFNKSICVHCTRETQLSRMASRGLSAEEAQDRLDAQWPVEEKLRRAHFCLFNEGNLLFLEQQILILMSRVA